MHKYEVIGVNSAQTLAVIEADSFQTDSYGRVSFWKENRVVAVADPGNLLVIERS